MNFWDSSAVIEAFDASSSVRRRFENLLRQKTRHAASRLILPEVVSALARRNRSNPAQASLAVREVMETFARFSLHPVADDLIEDSLAIAREDRLKGADAVHLATALSLARDIGRRGFAFITLDKELGAAARSRGLRVLGT